MVAASCSLDGLEDEALVVFPILLDVAGVLAFEEAELLLPSSASREEVVREAVLLESNFLEGEDDELKITDDGEMSRSEEVTTELVVSWLLLEFVKNSLPDRLELLKDTDAMRVGYVVAVAADGFVRGDL